MIEILRSIDPVVVSFIQALLREAGVTFHVADQHMSAVEGGINAFPCRVLVPADEAIEARRLLIEAGLEKELCPPAADNAHSAGHKSRWRATWRQEKFA